MTLPADLLSIPNELLSKIISYLDGRDIIELSSVNCRLNGQCNCHATWYNIVARYKLSEPTFYDLDLGYLSSMTWVSLKSLFVSVLDKFNWLLGLWKRRLHAFGGLLLVKLEMPECRIVGYDVLSVNLKLSLDPMFEIEIKTTETASEGICFTPHKDISCIFYSQTEHYLSIEFGIETEENEEETEEIIRIKCSGGDTRLYHDEEKMKSYLQEAVGMNHVVVADAILNCFDNEGIKYSRVSVPSVSRDKTVPVEPGFFAGDYSVHGSEILLLRYDVLNYILLEKISGDKNVRYGAISVEIDMYCPVDYSGVLESIAREPSQFTIKNAIEQFQIKGEHWSEKYGNFENNHIDEDLVEELKFRFPERSFGIDESNNTFIAAFKGKITLGMMPDAETPVYFYRDVLAVISSEDKLCVLKSIDGAPVGIHYIYEKHFKRLPL